MKITGIKKAVGTYKEWEDSQSIYIDIMLDRQTGEVWASEVASSTSYRVYGDPAIINLSELIKERHEKICVKTVKKYADLLIESYNRK